MDLMNCTIFQMAKLQHHAIVTISILGNKYLSSSKQIQRTFKSNKSKHVDFQIQTNKYGKHSNVCLLGTLITIAWCETVNGSYKVELNSSVVFQQKIAQGCGKGCGLHLVTNRR